MDTSEHDQTKNLSMYREIARFCYAVSMNNERALMEFIKNGCDVNATVASDNPFKVFSSNLAGMDALRFACKKPSTRSLDVLLYNSADFTMKDSSGSTALHSLVEEKCASPSKLIDYIGDVRCILPRILSAHVKNNVPTNPVNNHGLSHFHIACMVSHIEAVELFLGSGVQINEAIHNDSPILPGYTALHIASRYGRLEVVQILVSRGADAHARNKDGHVPLQLLCPRLEEMSYLALHPNSYRVFQRSQEFHLELQTDTYEIASILTQQTLNQDDSINDLCTACAKKDAASVNRILDKGVDMNAKTHFGFSALHCAALVDFDMTKLLLERGADIFLQNDDGRTPLDICTWKYGYDVTELLPFVQQLKGHINLDGQPWRIASTLENQENLKELLLDENVAQEINTPCLNPDSPLWPGATPLHLAILFARDNPSNDLDNPQCAENLIETLILHGASTTKGDAKGRTPVHCAFYCKKARILKMLMNPFYRSSEIQHLTSFENPVDKTGLSHFHIACTIGCQKSMGMILFKNAESVNEPTKTDVKIRLCPRKPEILLKAGSTPMHIAARLKKIEAIHLLAALNADIIAKDADGLTPVDLIVSNTDFDESELVEITFWLVNTYCSLNSETANDPMDHFNTLFAALDPVLYGARYGHNMRPCRFSCRKYLENEETGGSEKAKQLKRIFNFSEKVNESLNEGWHPSALVARYINGLKTILKKSSKYDLSVRDCFASYGLWILDERILMSQKVIDNDTQMTHLHLACALDLKEDVEMLLKSGNDVNHCLSSDSPFFPGFTPLHLAIRCYEEETPDTDAESMVKLMLTHGANPNIQDGNGETPLHIALRYCGKETSKTNAERIVKIMLEHGAGPTIQDVNGETPLHLADRFSSEKIKKLFLLDERVPKSNPISKFGRSHFHIACSSDLPEVVEKFLQHGADPNELNYAIDNRLWQVVSGDYNLNSFEFTPLQNATDLNVIKVLLKHGADPKIEDYKGWTALHHAAFSTCGDEVIKTLIRDGGADVNSRSVLHLTPLDLVVTDRIENDTDESQIRTLLEHGALVVHENFEESSTLARAFESYDINLVHILVKYGKDINDLNERKRTAMHELFFVNHVDDPNEYILIIEQLCRRGIDIDSQDSLKRTPLHAAVDEKLDDGIVALLACGADLNMVDCNKATPFSLLMTEWIEKKGAGHQMPSSYDKKRMSLLARHVQKMRTFNVPVIDQNLALEIQYTSEIDKSESIVDIRQEFEQSDEVKKMKDVVLEDNVTLRDVMYMNSHHLYTLIENEALTSTMRSDDFHEKFPEFGGILMLKFKIAQKRKAIEIARKSLHMLFRMLIPETCTEVIATYLSNKDLKTLADMIS